MLPNNIKELFQGLARINVRRSALAPFFSIVFVHYTSMYCLFASNARETSVLRLLLGMCANRFVFNRISRFAIL